MNCEEIKIIFLATAKNLKIGNKNFIGLLNIE